MRHPRLLGMTLEEAKAYFEELGIPCDFITTVAAKTATGACDIVGEYKVIKIKSIENRYQCVVALFDLPYYLNQTDPGE